MHRVRSWGRLNERGGGGLLRLTGGLPGPVIAASSMAAPTAPRRPKAVDVDVAALFDRIGECVRMRYGRHER